MIVFQGSIPGNMQRAKGVNIHNNILVLHEIFDLIFKLLRSGSIQLTQSSLILEKRADLGRKYVKRHPEQNN